MATSPQQPSYCSIFVLHEIEDCSNIKVQAKHLHTADNIHISSDIVMCYYTMSQLIYILYLSFTFHRKIYRMITIINIQEQGANIRILHTCYMFFLSSETYNVSLTIFYHINVFQIFFYQRCTQKAQGLMAYDNGAVSK